MKKYYAYVAKEVVGYFEEKLAEHGVKTITCEPINNGEIYHYVVEAEDGIIDPRFEIKGAQAPFVFTYLKGDYKMAKTNHQTGYHKAIKNPTTNYAKDSHKDFCKRCMSHNNGCPRINGHLPSKECSL